MHPGKGGSVLNGYLYRLYPDREQPQTLLRWIGCQQLIDAANVQEDRYYRRLQRRMVGTAGMEVPVDQPYSRFMTNATAFLQGVPPQMLRNGAVRFRSAYHRFFQKLRGRPKIKKKIGRQAVGRTREWFTFLPPIDDQTGAITAYPLTLGTKKFPVGIIPYRAHGRHAVPASIHIAVDRGQWWLSFAAEDSAVMMPETTAGRRESPGSPPSMGTIGQRKSNASAKPVDARTMRTTMPPGSSQTAASSNFLRAIR